MLQEWEKVLWKIQAYPDNYVPSTLFLASLQKNRTYNNAVLKILSISYTVIANFRPYTYWPLVILACAITQHLATTFIFLSVFVRLKEHTLDPRTLVSISVACFFIGYFIWNAHAKQQRLDRRATRAWNHFQIISLMAIHSNLSDLKALKSSIMMFLVLMSLSPVLRTLTAATSSDSIWALAAVLFMLNALLADYTANVSEDEINEGYVSSGNFNILKFFFLVSRIYLMNTRLSSVLSMNAAVSASVVLASRLSTNVSVFALMLFSILSFALFPILRRRLQVKSTPKSLLSLHWLFRLTVMFECSMAIDHSRVVDFGCRSSRGPVPHSYVDILFHFILCDMDSPSCLDLGTKIQKVRTFSFCIRTITSMTCLLLKQHHSRTMGRGCSQGKIDNLHSFFL